MLNTVSESLANTIANQLEILKKRRPHFLLVIDEIDAFSKSHSHGAFKKLIAELISKGQPQD